MDKRRTFLTRFSWAVFAVATLTLCTAGCGENSGFAPDVNAALPVTPSSLAINVDGSAEIKILSGELIFVVAPSVRSIELRGTQGLRLSGHFLFPNFGPEKQCPCVPGDAVPLDALISDSDFPGTATFRGKTYRMGGGGMFDASALLHITGGPVILPPFTAEGAVTLSAPFSLIAGTNASSLSIPGEPRRSLSGQGIASLRFRAQQHAPGQYVWVIASANYDFGH